ncbi:hypothetical protein GCM10010372_03520 [Streptomyces tauricus]|nr:hypothetical protein GCM10010372_03520 [Streptomyces tauricus]
MRQNTPGPVGRDSAPRLTCERWIGADNTADFSVTGDAISGAAGETVTAELPFKDNGPAWFGHLGSGDPLVRVRLIVPQGAKVTGMRSGARSRSRCVSTPWCPGLHRAKQVGPGLK